VPFFEYVKSEEVTSIQTEVLVALLREHSFQLVFNIAVTLGVWRVLHFG
jgi:hypothetical protein